MTDRDLETRAYSAYADQLSRQLATQRDRPTISQIEEMILSYKRAFPPINFDSWYEREKRLNTKRYQEVVAETNHLLKKS